MMRSPVKAVAVLALVALFGPLPATATGGLKPLSEAQLERLHKRNKRKAQEAWARDEKKMKREEFRQMESDYQEINNRYRDPEITEIIERFLKKYKEGNRVGCALMYLAQKSGGRDREKLLREAIEKHSDSYYLDGCCVGGLARLYLASHYKRGGDERKAKKLIAEIEEEYADAQDHSGKPIIEMARAIADPIADE